MECNHVFEQISKFKTINLDNGLPFSVKIAKAIKQVKGVKVFFDKIPDCLVMQGLPSIKAWIQKHILDAIVDSKCKIQTVNF